MKFHATTILIPTAIGLTIMWASLSGSGAYFANSRRWSGLATAGAVMLLLPFMAGLLRSWQGGFEFHGTSRNERLAGGMAAVLVCVAIGTTLLGRPAFSELDGALAAHDLSRARIVLQALKDTHGDSSGIRNAEDAVRLAEAGQLKGEPRLKLLDEVASHGGPKAHDAAAAARADRVETIKGANLAGAPDRALEYIARWFPAAADAEVLELKARAYDLKSDACKDAVCEFENKAEAARAVASPSRVKAASDAHSLLLARLAIPTVAGASVLEHLQIVRGIDDLATKATRIPSAPADIVESAKRASDWAASERGKVALIGSRYEVVAELLSGLTRSSDTLALAHLGPLDAYVPFDASGRCRGLYVVGSSDNHRIFVSSEWTPSRLIGQTIGKPVATLSPPKRDALVRWYESGTPVVARYREDMLVELRVGDAAP